MFKILKHYTDSASQDLQKNYRKSLKGQCHEMQLIIFYLLLTESQAASCMQFQCENRHFRILEAGYWKDFQN